MKTKAIQALMILQTLAFGYDRPDHKRKRFYYNLITDAEGNNCFNTFYKKYGHDGDTGQRITSSATVFGLIEEGLFAPPVIEALGTAAYQLQQAPQMSLTQSAKRFFT